MNCLAITLFLSLAYFASADGTSKQANERVYHTVSRPYSYRPYGVDSHYNYNTEHDTETFGAYPSTFDLGAHRLHLSGGIYRPYGHDDNAPYGHNYQGYDSGYNRPYTYDNAYKIYGNSAVQYVRYPYASNGRH